MRTAPYSKFTKNIAALIGIEEANLQSQELAMLNTFFSKNIRYIWEQSNWIDLCPYGEYVSANNLLTWYNTFENPDWDKSTGTLVVDNTAQNPISGAMDATKVTTTVANATIGQYFYPKTISQCYFGVWLRSVTPATINLQALRTSDSLIVANQSFSVGTTWAYYILPFTPVDPTLHTVQIGGSNVIGAGLEFYIWQAAAVDSSAMGSGLLIPWSSTGGPDIDIPIALWKDPPFNPQPARRVGYRTTKDGLKINDQAVTYTISANQIITTTVNTAPIQTYYLWYRKKCPDYFGDAWDNTVDYKLGDQVLYTYTNQSGKTVEKDFYKCIESSPAGTDPRGNPQNWQKLEIPYGFMDYAVYASFADWLMVEGQGGKAGAISTYAQDLMTKELERQELQMGVMMPTKFTTHVTSQAYY